MKHRLDALLHLRGFFESRSRAAAAVTEGRVEVNGVLVCKPSFAADENADITVIGGDPYVSRAYRKLDFALNAFAADVNGAVALDVGASTGGFTQCLLERGARRVYAVDVGTGQLHHSLRADSRVVNMEGTNARTLQKSSFPEQITVAVMDVSFISQSKIYPALSGILPASGLLISLVKPQFEAGREKIGKKGIVKDRDGGIIEAVRCSLTESAAENGLFLKAFAESPIKGGDGNREYLALFIAKGRE